ncbi:MAG: glycosyltransferase family 2 protein [Turicibacter sp.]
MYLNVPLITFIIPAYNSSSYIQRCLRSILSLVEMPLEIIVIDDGSTDDTLTLLHETAQLDDRVRVFHKKNEGQGVARNFGLNFAKGKFISFIDSDDYISSDFILRLKPYLFDDEFDFINFRIDFRNELGQVKHILPKFKMHNLSGDDIFKKAMLDDSIYSSPCNKIYKATFLKENDIKFPSTRKNEDVFFSRALALFANRCIFINDVIYHVEIRPGSTSRGMSALSISDTIKIYDYLEGLLKSYNAYNKHEELFFASIKKMFSHLFILCSIRIEGREEYLKAFEIFKQSMYYNKFMSVKGFRLLKIKNKVLFLIVYFFGQRFLHGFATKLLRRHTY